MVGAIFVKSDIQMELPGQKSLGWMHQFLVNLRDVKDL